MQHTTFARILDAIASLDLGRESESVITKPFSNIVRCYRIYQTFGHVTFQPGPQKNETVINFFLVPDNV